MSSLSKRGITVTVFIGCFMFFSFAQAQTPFDFTECASVTITPVFKSKDITIAGLEAKGIIFSNHENKVFDNCSFHVVVISKTVGRKRTSDSYWKIMDRDGDVVIAEVAVIGREKTMKFLHGTGKWKGIKGEAKGKMVAIGKPVAAGTVQTCSRYVGSFELAK